MIDTNKLQVGFKPYRLVQNDPYYAKEIAFVEIANERITQNDDFLANIISHPNHPSWLEPQEEQIVLSVLQWLGTPVGQSFIDDVNEKVKSNEGNIQKK